MENISHLFWKVLSEYIPAKDKEIAASHLVTELIDAGIDEEDLWAAAKGSNMLKSIISEHIDPADDYDDDEED